MNLSYQIASMVRFHRKKAKLTQLQLAQLAGIGKTTVFDIEKGKISIELSSLLAVLHILNIKIIFQSPLMSLYEQENAQKSKSLCQ